MMRKKNEKKKKKKEKKGERKILNCLTEIAVFP